MERSELRTHIAVLKKGINTDGSYMEALSTVMPQLLNFRRPDRQVKILVEFIEPCKRIKNLFRRR